MQEVGGGWESNFARTSAKHREAVVLFDDVLAQAEDLDHGVEMQQDRLLVLASIRRRCL